MFYDLFIKVEGRGIGQTRPEPHEVPEIPGLQAFPERHPGSGVARRGLWILDAHRGKRLHAAGVEGAASLEVQIFAQTLRAVAKAEVGPSKECQTRQEASLVQLPKDVVVEDFLLHSRQKIALDIPSARQRARHAHRTKCSCWTLLVEEVAIPPCGDQVGTVVLHPIVVTIAVTHASARNTAFMTHLPFHREMLQRYGGPCGSGIARRVIPLLKQG